MRHTYGTRKSPGEQIYPSILHERVAIAAIGEAIKQARLSRDAGYERCFNILYSGDSPTPEAETNGRFPV